MYSLALFDLDGTLLDTIDDLAGACNHALAARGFPTHDRDAYKYFVGRGARKLVARALAPITDTASIQEVEAVFRSYYSQHDQVMTRPYPGVSAALGALRQAGVDVAVLSNKPHPDVQRLVQCFFPETVAAAWGQREGVPAKPDPAVLLEILAHFGYRPEDCIYFGDSGVDMQTGKSADVYTVGVSWGFRTKQELWDAGADDIIDKTEQIVKKVVDK